MCKGRTLSGVAEHIDKILSELEDTRVLSSDGTSAEALEYARLPFSRGILVH